MSKRVDPQLYNSFTGLKNTVSEERLSPTDLAVAENVDIDDAGQLHRRRGFTLVASGDYHSLHSAPTDVYVTKDGDLCVLNRDYTTVTLATGVGSRAVAYVDIGDETYVSTETSSWVIANRAATSWGAPVSPTSWESPVVNPTATLPEVGGVLTSAPPTATSLAYLNGRIYLADDRLLWATELYRYQHIDRTKNYIQFEAPITGIVGATDGLYVGTTEAVYFLAGTFGEMVRTTVVDSGLVSGSIVIADPKDLGEQAAGSKAAVFFLTHLGVYAGLDSGVCYALTQEAFIFPTAQSAAAMYRQQDGVGQYVGVMNSSGTPTSNARFGDYVDAEIRRFTGN